MKQRKNQRYFAKAAARLVTFGNFSNYCKDSGDTKAEIYDMYKIARMIGWDVILRQGTLLERIDGEYQPIYIIGNK